MLRLLFPALLICTSCASIVAGGPDFIPVQTTPPGATVYLDNVPIGVTPTVAAVPRESECELRLELAGHKTVLVDRDKVLNGWFLPGGALWLLVWPAFPVSIGVDLATHNQGKYSTIPVHVELQPGDPSEIIGLPAVRVAAKDG